jgi:DNA-binding transcriptional MocR family regulator
MDEVRHAVVAGALRPDYPIPSVRELSAQLVVTPRTVSQAYQELEREGVLYRRGQGTFVSPDVRADRRVVAREVATRALLEAVGRYRVEVPMGWHAPHELHVAGVRSNGVREAQWTLVGDQRELINRLTLAGAHVRDVQALALADAALAFLAQDVTR